MRTQTRIFILLLPMLIQPDASASVSATAGASASDRCKAAKGSLVVGTVVQAAQFLSARETLQGVSLSHTHVRLRPDRSHEILDVAMDNAFAPDFDASSADGPASLMALKEGDRLQLCGQLYRAPEKGIRWVHTNCGDAASPKSPDGWVARLDQDGNPGANLEGSSKYCYLWPTKGQRKGSALLQKALGRART